VCGRPPVDRRFTAFTSYVYLFFWPIRGFGRALNHFSRTMVAAGRIEEVFKAEEEEGLDSGLTPDLGGDIRFENVSFATTRRPSSGTSA
jgi:ATP-binding cassette subfamily B protein